MLRYNIVMSNLKTEEWIAIVIAVGLGIFGYLYANGNLSSQVANPDELAQDTEIITTNFDYNMDDSGLEIITTQPGSGPEAEAGDVVIVNYRGKLADTGAEFDNSYDRGQPFPVELGQARVIAGWELGLIGAQTGQALTLNIPSSLGYGEMGTPGGPIPPNADLVFDIEVLQVIKADELQALQQ